MSKKPYIYEDAEGWLQITKRKDWNDPKNNPHDLLPYSEFQRPYGPGKKRSYPEWEWTFDDDDMPPIDDITYPDPIENECSIDEDCIWAGVIGPDEMECGDCYTFTQAHIWLGCEVAPWWAAFGSWTLSSETEGGNCYQLFTGPIMTTVCCEDGAYGGFTVTYQGPLNCQGSKAVTVSCLECCDEYGLTGDDTVAAGNIWYGTVFPRCPTAECEVESNSGCSIACFLSESGTTVLVDTSPGHCGSFTVTVTHPGVAGECDPQSATKGVRILGGTGAWKFIDGGTSDCIGGSCGCTCSGPTRPFDACISGTIRYGIGGDPTDCSGKYGFSCMCGGTCEVGPGPWPGCHPGGGSCGSCGSACGGNCQGVCLNKSYWRCQWKCTC